MRNGGPQSNGSFACFPRELLLNPPMEHWQPFEFAVAAALLSRARRVIDDGRHAGALEIGERGIAEERKRAEQFKADWKATRERRRQGQHVDAPERKHIFKAEATHKPAPFRKAMRAAGKHGYTIGKKELRKARLPEVIPFEISRSGLLHLAGLSADAKNLKRLDSALSTLCQPVQTENIKREALLHSVRLLPSAQIRLRVCGDWLEPPYAPVPIPMPTRSAPGLALYLFLHCIRTGALNDRGIKLETLCKKLGMDIARGGWACRRALYRALDVVNNHLPKLDSEALSKHNLKVAGEFSFQPCRDDESSIRFTSSKGRLRPLEDLPDEPDESIHTPPQHEKPRVSRGRNKPPQRRFIPPVGETSVRSGRRFISATDANGQRTEIEIDTNGNPIELPELDDEVGQLAVKSGNRSGNWRY